MSLAALETGFLIASVVTIAGAVLEELPLPGKIIRVSSYFRRHGARAGIKLLSERWVKVVEGLGFVVLIVGLSSELVYEKEIESRNAVISERQRSKIIELETRLLPTYLDTNAQSRVAAQICSFGPKPFNVLYIDMGDALFPSELFSALGKCNWLQKGGLDEATATKIGPGPTGMQFVYDSAHANEFEAVAVRLAKALEEENVIASVRAVKNIAAPYNTRIIVVFGRR